MKRSNPFEDSPDPDPVNRVEQFLKSATELKFADALENAHPLGPGGRSRFHVTLLCSEDWLTRLVRRALEAPLTVVAFSKLEGEFLVDVCHRSSILILRDSPEMDVTEVLSLLGKLNFVPRLPTIVLGEAGSVPNLANTDDLQPVKWLEPSDVESELESAVWQLLPPDPDESAAD